MIKKYKKTLIVTSIVILLPVVVGLLLWNKLPDQVATHWDLQGNANGWSPKEFAVFGLPLILFVTNVICIAGVSTDPKRKNVSEKIVRLLLWIVPVVSLITTSAVYAAALGYAVDIGMICSVLVGVLFIVVGNYLPKNKQSYTVGIKLPWTLHSEENWNRTHRLAGRVWMLSGVLVILGGVLRTEIFLVLGCVIAVAVPTGYSYLLYRKVI